MKRNKKNTFFRQGILLLVLQFAAPIESHSQTPATNELVGKWETLDKEPHLFTLSFTDSIHVELMQFGNAWAQGVSTYRLDTLKGNTMLIIKGRNPVRDRYLDTCFIKFVNSDTMKMHGRFDENQITGIISEDQWNDKNTSGIYKTGTIVVKRKKKS